VTIVGAASDETSSDDLSNSHAQLNALARKKSAEAHTEIRQ
jgi:hypothetical protein